MILEEFVQWHEKVKDTILHVHTLLSDRLSPEPEALIQDLEAIEAWNARMGELLAEANSWLDKSRGELVRPKEEGGTDLTRKLALDAEVSPVRLVRDKIESICETIKQRLILGESILAYARQFGERTINTRGESC